MKTAIFHLILGIVSQICEISTTEIVSKVKRADVVEARTMCIYQCVKYGFTYASIAKFFGRKRTYFVNDAMYNYKRMSEKSASFRYLCHEIDKKIQETLPEESR